MPVTKMYCRYGSIKIANFSLTLFTQCPSETTWTSARDLIDTVSARCVVLTGQHSTLVNVYVTVGAHEAGVGAIARVHIHPILTLATIQARLTGAIINIHLTVVTRVSGLARAGETVDAVDARCAVHALTL